jgi:hypothetical protein
LRKASPGFPVVGENSPITPRSRHSHYKAAATLSCKRHRMRQYMSAHKNGKPTAKAQGLQTYTQVERGIYRYKDRDGVRLLLEKLRAEEAGTEQPSSVSPTAGIQVSKPAPLPNSGQTQIANPGQEKTYSISY